MVELCLPGHTQCGAATFCPTGWKTLEKEWDEWVEEIYLPTLACDLSFCYTLCALNEIGDYLNSDVMCGCMLEGAVGERSIAVGRRTLIDYLPPRGAKMLGQYRRMALNDTQRGHMVLVLLMRGFIFHLPVLEISIALLLAESVLGARSIGVTLPAEQLMDMIRRVREPTFKALAVEIAAV